MILFDTETTGLLLPDVADLKKQPKIIEFAAIKLCDETLKEKGRLDLLINPNEEITPFITKLTGITNEMVLGKPCFADAIGSIVDFFLGERTLVAHNLGFDSSVLRNELKRLGKEFQFPWSPDWVCTVERTFDIRGRRLKLSDAYELSTGKEFKEAHRAMKDVEALVEVVRFLKKEGKL